MKYHLILKISVLYIGLFLLRVIFTLLLLQIHVVSLRLEFAQTQLSFERDNLRHRRSPCLKFAHWQRGWNGWKENWGEYFSVYSITKYFICITDKRQEVTKDTYGADLNCTVAFMSQCYSLRKCKESCKSMGAARYRWFHEQGCCQCIGDTCISYGLNR